MRGITGSQFYLPFSDVPVENPSPNCSMMTCKNGYQLPINFSQNSIIVDLGRTVQLNTLTFTIKSYNWLGTNLPFPKLALQFKNYEFDNNSKNCSFTRMSNNSDTFDYVFWCAKGFGRFLNISITLPQLLTTTNRLTTVAVTGNNSNASSTNSNKQICCVFQPANGCSATRSLVKIYFLRAFSCFSSK